VTVSSDADQALDTGSVADDNDIVVTPDVNAQFRLRATTERHNIAFSGNV